MSFTCQVRKAMGQSEGALGNESLQKGQGMKGGSSLLEPGGLSSMFPELQSPIFAG